MPRWSLVAALLGLVATRAGVAYLDRPDAARPPAVHWLLGLAALLPAWVIAFVGLLEGARGQPLDRPVSAWWLLSTGTALLGVILTDATVRRRQDVGASWRPAWCWLLGVAALVPAWAIALLAGAWASAVGDRP